MARWWCGHVLVHVFSAEDPENLGPRPFFSVRGTGESPENLRPWPFFFYRGQRRKSGESEAVTFFLYRGPPPKIGRIFGRDFFSPWGALGHRWSSLHLHRNMGLVFVKSASIHPRTRTPAKITDYRPDAIRIFDRAEIAVFFRLQFFRLQLQTTVRTVCIACYVKTL